ncbi:MAG: single-stranded DNA-binding protein [bacterium]
MNKVIIIGRLTKDPEIRVTQSGKKVASLSIAVDDGKDANGQKLTQYFNASAWDVLAERFESFVKKGHRVCVIGKLQNRSWDKPDGTKGYATDVQVRELELLTSKSEAEALDQGSNDSEEYHAPATSSKTTTKPASKKKEESADEELPEIDVDSINVQMPF